jgi:hypothetical protein
MCVDVEYRTVSAKVSFQGVYVEKRITYSVGIKRTTFSVSGIM